MRRMAVAAAVAGAMAGWCAPTAGAIVEYVHFSLPSGNIGCIIGDEYVRCDIGERSWTPPPKPADCVLDFGHAIWLQVGEPAEILCAGDTTLGGDEVLAYGQSMTRGSLECASSETGLTCHDRTTGHGFSLSRERYQLF